MSAIDRPINGVIKADQFDAESVWQELDEYVVTKELDIHFRKFFDAYLHAIDKPAIRTSPARSASGSPASSAPASPTS